MKQCPTCRREYSDETLNFCLDDGAWLSAQTSLEDNPTELMSRPRVSGESQTRIFDSVSSGSGVRSGNSIAVLPFAHLSSDPDDEYFCDGLAEELLNTLAQLDGLKVVARTSAFSFKGKNATAAE